MTRFGLSLLLLASTCLLACRAINTDGPTSRHVLARGITRDDLARVLEARRARRRRAAPSNIPPIRTSALPPVQFTYNLCPNGGKLGALLTSTYFNVGEPADLTAQYLTCQVCRAIAGCRRSVPVHVQGGRFANRLRLLRQVWRELLLCALGRAVTADASDTATGSLYSGSNGDGCPPNSFESTAGESCCACGRRVGRLLMA